MTMTREELPKPPDGGPDVAGRKSTRSEPFAVRWRSPVAEGKKPKPWGKYHVAHMIEARSYRRPYPEHWSCVCGMSEHAFGENSVYGHREFEFVKLDDVAVEPCCSLCFGWLKALPATIALREGRQEIGGMFGDPHPTARHLDTAPTGTGARR